MSFKLAYKSITAKLLTLMICTFFITLIIILLAANTQLRKIIDKSQFTISSEKIEIIMKDIERTHNRLEQTGLIEVYIDDFQNSLLKRLKETYYKDNNFNIYPFILNAEWNVILHPTLPKGDTSLSWIESYSQWEDEEKSIINISFENRDKWYVLQHFRPWNWTVVFTIPLKEKYGDKRHFLQILSIIMFIVSALFLPFLSLIVFNITKPIVRLSNIAQKISQGELTQEIPVEGYDEISVLSQSFVDMQQAIKHKIEDLNREMTEKIKMKEQLIQAQKMDAIGQLAGGVAHDFNNMLAGISGSAQLLKLDEQLSGNSKNLVNIILEASERASDLTAKLLTFGRKGTIGNSTIDIHKVIDDTLSLLKRALDKKNPDYNGKGSTEHPFHWRYFCYSKQHYQSGA